MMHYGAGTLISEQKELLAEKLVSAQFAEQPHLRQHYGAKGRQKCREDAEYHFAALAESVRFDCLPLFSDYVRWAKVLLASLGIPEADLVSHLLTMLRIIEAELPEPARHLARNHVQAALEELPTMPGETESSLTENNPCLELARQWLDRLLERDTRSARRLVMAALENGATVSDVYNYVLAPGLREVGRLWQIRRINEALEHYCSETTYTLLAILGTYADSAPQGRVAVGLCVAMEQHELGLRLALNSLQLQGWDTVFLGANVPTPNIPAILSSWQPDLLVVSVTMAYHLQEAKQLIGSVRDTKPARVPRVIVGGRPFDICPGLWRRVGADGHAEDFSGLVELADSLQRR